MPVKEWHGFINEPALSDFCRAVTFSSSARDQYDWLLPILDPACRSEQSRRGTYHSRMNSAVTFALLSLCFAGLNGVVFKRFSAKVRSRGALVFGIGLVWLLLQALTMLGTGRMPHADST